MGPNNTCHCGCGEITPVITKNNTKRGYVVGEHRKYVKGHHNRSWPGFTIENHGFYTPCHIWRGYIDKNGYAWHSGVHVPRIMWEREYHEPFPEGLEPDHLCRVRSCVNVAHIEPVTHAENVRRSERKTKTHCPQGHPYTAENTYEYKGLRNCRICGRTRAIAFYHKKRALIKEMQAGNRQRHEPGCPSRTS